jgi:hypothetical protein
LTHKAPDLIDAGVYILFTIVILVGPFGANTAENENVPARQQITWASVESITTNPGFAAESGI